MGEWADGEYPESFLDKLLRGEWKKHYDACPQCWQTVEYYRKERQKKFSTK